MTSNTPGVLVEREVKMFQMASKSW